jgi:flavin-binding protein dodecin
VAPIFPGGPEIRRPHTATRSAPSPTLEQLMSVAKITEIQASSTTSFDDAIKAGITRADKTLRNVTGAWVKSQKVVIEKGKITEYRVLMKVSFILQDK